MSLNNFTFLVQTIIVIGLLGIVQAIRYFKETKILARIQITLSEKVIASYK